MVSCIFVCGCLALQVPYVYEYVTKLCRRQAEIIHNNESENVSNIGQDETPHKKYKWFGGGNL
jgi:hypothetical protein